MYLIISLAARPLALLILLAAAVPAVEASLVTAIALALDTLLPLALQFFPVAVKGTQMALIAIGISILLGLADLLATGQLANFSAANAAIVLLAFIGATQGFYAIFKKRWNLADPPGTVSTPAVVKTP